MVDNVNPTNQFHPYQPVDAVPHTESRRSGLDSVLRRVGIDSNTIRNADVRGSVEKARGYARQHPGAVLGGLAALAIGLGMMRGRGTR